jgi:hypothetical protein
MSGRSARWSGVAFVVLLLLQAGMADIPTLDTPIDRIQVFYANHGGIIVVAQIISVAASILFFFFARGLARDVNGGSHAGATKVRWAGAFVAIASVATAIPPLSLAIVSSPSDTTAHSLTRAADITDAVLFAVIGLFALALFRAAVPGWVKAFAVVVAALSLARAVLGFAEVTMLDVIGPLAFLAFVLTVSVAALRGWLSPGSPRSVGGQTT